MIAKIRNNMEISNFVDDFFALFKIIFQLRKQIMKYTLCHFRLILAIFLLVLFPPFQMLTRFRWFRHRYYIFVKLTCKVAMFFDFLHR